VTNPRNLILLGLLASCTHSQPQPTGDSVDPFNALKCRKKEIDAHRLRVIGEVAPPDVDAIRAEIARVSPDLVVMVRTEPPGFEDLKTKYGRGLIEVETLKSWSCLSSEGESLFAVHRAGRWQVVEERYEWTACD
jgi:hypothetical protein